MKKKLVISVLTAGVLMMTGCGDSSNDNPDATVIQEAGKQALTALKVQPLGGGAKPAPSRAVVRQAVAFAAQAPQTSNCPISGTMIFDSVTGDVTYNLCTYNDTNIGDFSFDGSLQNGVGAIITAYANYSYKLTYEVDATMRYVTFNDLVTTPNAPFKFSDYRIGVSKDIYEVSNCTIDDSGTEICSESKYEDPRDESVDGNLTILDETSCLTGNYILKTEEAMHILPDSNGFIESGRLDINGVKIEYNSDKTLTITYEDGATDIIAQDAQINCN